MTGDNDQWVDLNRLRWQCRRGMLELDYLLLDFLEQQFPGLSPPRQEDFVRLLGESDQDLQRWLIGGEMPRDAGFAALIAELFSLRQAGLSRGR